MKKSFFLMSLLLSLFVSVFALTACSDDDDDKAPDTLAGTEWKCTYSDGWVVEVIGKSSTVFLVTEIDPQGEIREEYEYQYSYDGATGVGRAVTDDGTIVTFAVTGNILTAQIVGGNTLTFKRTK